MSIVLNTAPSQARQATNTAVNADQQAPLVRPAADAGARPPAKDVQPRDTGAAKDTTRPKTAAGNDAKTPPASGATAPAAAPANAAAAGSSAAAATPADPAAASAGQPLFAQLLGQADQNDADAGKKGDDKTDKTDDQTAAATGSGAMPALLPAMAAPLMALVQTMPAAVADAGGAGQPADADAATAATPVAAPRAAAPQVPAANAALLNVMNPAAAMNAQAMSAQAASAVAQIQGQGQPAGSAANGASTTASSAAASAPAAAASSAASSVTAPAASQTYADIVAQLLTNRAPANTTTPLAAAPVTTAGTDGDAGANAGAPPSAPVLAATTLAAHATGGDADGTGTPAPAAGDPAFGIAAPAPAAGGNVPSTTLTLSGPAQQWQQPLQQALGDRLQMQLNNNSQQAVIRLEPPNLGSIEIAIRHADGALQVNLSASNSDVLRQLHTIGDSVRQDLSTRQYTDVAVTVSATPRSGGAQNFADGGGDGRQRQPGQDAEEHTPGRALAENEQPYTATFALNDRE